MKTCAAFPLVLAIALGIVVKPAFASPANVAVDPSPAFYSQMVDRAEGQAFSLNGRVESVDYASNVIVVRSKGDLVTIRITPTTSFERGGEVGSIADIRPGRRVRVKGTISNGDMIAESVIIK